MMKNTVEPRALNTPDAAKYIGMSNEFLRRTRIKGQVKEGAPVPKFIKIGRLVRYIKDDLDEWLDSLKKREHLVEPLE